MTPLWRRAVKEAMASRSEQVRLAGEAIIRAHHCFDLSLVAPLLEQVAHEIAAAVNAAPGQPIDLGEAAVLPADTFWVEWGDVGLLMGPWRREVSHGVMLWVVRKMVDPDGAQVPFWGADEDVFTQQFVNVGNLSEDGDGSFSLFAPQPVPGRSDLVVRASASLSIRGLAALAIINSPSAKRRPVEHHKGTAKLIRPAQSGAPTAQHSRIVIGLGGTAGVEGSLASTTSPRAYHFCRAHTRVKGGR